VVIPKGFDIDPKMITKMLCSSPLTKIFLEILPMAPLRIRGKIEVRFLKCGI
jgi:hypothetical protein